MYRNCLLGKEDHIYYFNLYVFFSLFYTFIYQIASIFRQGSLHAKNKNVRDAGMKIPK